MAVTRFWTVVPAAGSGQRMGAGSVPKQYLPLAGATVIEHALRPFLEHPGCSRIIVAIAADDRRWPQLECSRHPKVTSVIGGRERTDSVLAGLEALRGPESRDWILVHDAARPCLSAGELAALLEALAGDDVGGLLAAPVVDTLKRVESDRVTQTVDRAALWRALTPQMFRYDILLRALRSVGDSSAANTDEAQAVERLGLRPRVVHGSADNLKITIPEDLVRAEHIFAMRRSPQ